MEDQSIWSSLIDQHMDSIETLRSVDRWMYKEVKGAFSSLFSAAEFVSPKNHHQPRQDRAFFCDVFNVFPIFRIASNFHLSELTAQKLTTPGSSRFQRKKITKPRRKHDENTTKNHGFRQEVWHLQIPPRSQDPVPYDQIDQRNLASHDLQIRVSSASAPN